MVVSTDPNDGTESVETKSRSSETITIYFVLSREGESVSIEAASTNRKEAMSKYNQKRKSDYTRGIVSLGSINVPDDTLKLLCPNPEELSLDLS